MTDIIDINAERNKREQPDAEHIKDDGFGRPMYRFILDYDFEGGTFCFDLWAYDAEDAQKRANAIACSVRVAGQVYAAFPA